MMDEDDSYGYKNLKLRFLILELEDLRNDRKRIMKKDVRERDENTFISGHDYSRYHNDCDRIEHIIEIINYHFSKEEKNNMVRQLIFEGLVDPIRD